MPPAGTTVPAEKVPAPTPQKQSEAASPARVVVELPADAKLFVDDQLMKTTSERRVFNTPALDATQTYYYEMRAELVRDGKTLTERKRVIVRAGDVIRTSFPNLELAATTAKREATAKR
jgi:uncharacterized protein (TIGR03000 family)